MRRVAVVGCSGSGKTTFALRLAAATGLPVIHLDAHFWRPGWVASTAEEWNAEHRALLQPETWIADGNYGSTLEVRFAEADTIIDLDRSRFTCLRRVISRAIRYSGRTRPDMNAGCPERLDPGHLLYLWNFPRRHRPRLEAALARARVDGRRVVKLRSDADAERYLAFVSAVRPATR